MAHWIYPSKYLYTTKGAETAIDRNHRSGNKFRGVTQEPQYRSKQIFRIAESSAGGMVNDGLASRGKLTGFFIR